MDEIGLVAKNNKKQLTKAISHRYTQIITNEDDQLSNITIKGLPISGKNNLTKDKLNNNNTINSLNEEQFKGMENQVLLVAPNQNVFKKLKLQPKNILPKKKALKEQNKLLLRSTHIKFIRSKTLQTTKSYDFQSNFQTHYKLKNKQITFNLTSKSIDSQNYKNRKSFKRNLAFQNDASCNFKQMLSQFHKAKQNMLEKNDCNIKTQKNDTIARKLFNKPNAHQCKEYRNHGQKQKQLQQTRQFFQSIFYKCKDPLPKTGKAESQKVQQQQKIEKVISNTQIFLETSGQKVFIYNWSPKMIRKSFIQASHHDERAIKQRNAFLQIKRHSFSQTQHQNSYLKKNNKKYLNKTMQNYKKSQKTILENNSIEPWQTSEPIFLNF